MVRMVTRNGSTRAWRRARARVVRAESHCAICGDLVDKALKWPDPMSPSVDHIDPIALGGANLDRANHALTHLHCNIAKGTGVPKDDAFTTRTW